MSKNILTIKKRDILINGAAILPKGLRCSSALYTDEVTDDLVSWLPEYKKYGINSFSVFLMGNRFTDICGYNEDASLNTVYTERLKRILNAADELDLMVVVGCLYWGESKAKWKSWTQKEAELAVKNTVTWLVERNYRHVIVDVDNEGMAYEKAGFDTEALIEAAHSVDPSIMTATNTTMAPPENADLSIHHAHRSESIPYIETEGTPRNAPGAYWERWSRKADGMNNYGNDPNYWNYINIGIYTEEMKKDQIQETIKNFERGDGYFFASTWLQAPSPDGPNHHPGGPGTADDPGMLWWLEWLRDSEY